MFGLIGRNIVGFLRRPSHIFLSVLGALIGFILYLTVLKSSLSDYWNVTGVGFTAISTLLDSWVTAGMLSIIGFTVPMAAMGQMLRDGREGTISVFCREMGAVKCHLAYLLSGIICGMIAEFVVYALDMLFFIWTTDDYFFFLDFDWTAPLKVALLLAIDSVMGALFAYVVLHLVCTRRAYTIINVIMGATAGFLSGAYVPVGVMPSALSYIARCTPLFYISAAMRHLFENKYITLTFRIAVDPNYEEDLFRRSLGVGSVSFNSPAMLTAGQNMAMAVFTLALVILLAIFVNGIIREIRRIHWVKAILAR